MVVYLDMDGVLADWFGGLQSLVGMKPDEIDAIFSNKTERQKFKEKNVIERKLYLNLPLVKDAKRLVKFILNNFDECRILSACGPYATAEVMKQKRIWLKNHFPELSNNPIFVIKAKQKALFSKKGAILIDDMEESINPFRSCGDGYGVLYKNYSSAIKELNRIKELDSGLTNLKLSNLLHEVLITIGDKSYPKFNSVVIMAGGSASGKGGFKDKLSGIEGITIDIDQIKELVLIAIKLNQKLKNDYGIVINDPNEFQKSSENAHALHLAMADLKLKDKKISTLFRSIILSPKNRKPNLIFDETIDTFEKFHDICKNLELVGYDKNDIHVIWVLNAIEVAIKQNIERKERTTPIDVLISKHEGVSLTMKKIVDLGEKLYSYMNGDITVVFNNRENSDVLFIVGDKKTHGGYIKKADYLKIKEQGKPVDSNKITKDFLDKVIEYTPKTKTWADPIPPSEFN